MGSETQKFGFIEQVDELGKLTTIRKIYEMKFQVLALCQSEQIRPDLEKILPRYVTRKDNLPNKS